MPNTWLEGYTAATKLIHNNIEQHGWARAKGYIKTCITYRLERAQQFYFNDEFLAGMTDATMDSVN